MSRERMLEINRLLNEAGNNAGDEIGEHMGIKMYMLGNSHSAPSIGIRGERTVRKLQNSISRELKKRKAKAIKTGMAYGNWPYDKEGNRADGYKE